MKEFYKHITLLLYFLLLFESILFAQIQKLNQMQILGDAEFQPNDLIGNDIRDSNGEVCAGLLISTDLTGLSYDSNNGIIKVKSRPGSDLLYLSPSERVVTLYKGGYESLRIILNDHDINFRSGQVWKITIASKSRNEQIPLNIISVPSDANIYIDEKIIESRSTFKVGMGKHEVRIEKSGYKTMAETIFVSDTSNLYEYVLDPIDPLKVTIKSIPSNSRLFIDDIEKGNTDKDLFLFPGNYHIRINRSGYIDLVDTVQVIASENNIFNYELIENSELLHLDIFPEDAKVLINKEDFSGQDSIKLAQGLYLIEVSKEGYHSINENIEVKLGSSISKKYHLEQIVGDLQITVNPLDANVNLKDNNGIFDNWFGSKLYKEIPAGTYLLEVSKINYESVMKEIRIDEQRTTEVNVTLTELDTVSNDLFEINMVFVKGGKLVRELEESGKVIEIILDDFFIGKYEVKFEEYDQFCRSTGRIKPSDNGWGRIRRPAININWNDAIDYCRWLSEVRNESYRLPTEAEWEYAAKAGFFANSFKFSGSDSIDQVAWYYDNSNLRTSEVGAKKQNEIGVHDMSGNVWEWCSDWYDSVYYSTPSTINPKGPISGLYKVLRGGGWADRKYYCQINIRKRRQPANRDNQNGFRVVKEIK